MRLVKPADGVVFAENELEEAYISLSDNSPLKNSIKNLWWYPLSDAWRLVYSIVTPSNIEILAVIIDYYNHKDYERKFGY